MKKEVLLFVALFISSTIAYGQWNTVGTVTSTSNSVGIGTTTAPVSVFQVNSGPYKFSAGSAPQGDLHFGTSYIGFNAARIGVLGSANWTIDGDGSHNGGGVIYTDILGTIYFAPLASAGTGSRTLADLDIKNNIAFRVGYDGVSYAKAMALQITGWPDYVFKKDYRLPALSDIGIYVIKNQHLPEMPSAREIEKDGMNVGEMNKLMLKKIEELTLYLIEKDKKITDLTNQLSDQQRQIDAIKTQLINKK